MNSNLQLNKGYNLFSHILKTVTKLTIASHNPLRFGVPRFHDDLSNSNETLTFVLLRYLNLLNPEECHRLKRSLAKGSTDSQVANELICALLYEIEQLCDKTIQVIDYTVQLFKTNVQSIDLTILSWIKNLQNTILAKVGLLKTIRLILVELSQNFQFSFFYRTDKTLIPLHVHICASYANINVIIDDAELILKTLTWYHNVLSFCIFTTENQLEN